MLTAALAGHGQIVTECPQNIGFENSTLSNWESYTGNISGTGNLYPNAVRPAVIQVARTAPQSGIHTLIKRGSGNDPYGDFTLDAPNGSDYIIQLGNGSNGRGAESISYTLTVPSNVEAYSIVFNYAVVLENPSHEFDEQPKFTAKVIDVSTNTYTECGSFEFTAPGANGGIPGFARSPQNDSVLFKPWSPVMVNLTNYLGKTIRLEFTTNDCSRGRHFGYAYLDFNENCSIPVIGNVTCDEANTLTLRVVPGLAGYRWFNSETGETLGSSESLTLSPAPPVGTRIGVELMPYPGLGCRQVLYTTITNMYMNITSPPERCTSVDITATSVTVGNSSDLTYTYWKDPDARIPLPDPRHVMEDGTYYIKGRSSSGCTMTLPVEVIITRLEPLQVFQPPTVAYPTTVDITDAVVHEEWLRYTYWTNQQATIPLKTPAAIRLPGTYYIKAENDEGCTVVAPVVVNIILPDFMIPNTFTPNGDGINDVFTVIVGNSYTIKSFKIFNRWGDIVYETTDIYKYWDGLKENTNVPTGVYFWVLDGDENLKSFKKSGYVTVLR